MSTPTPTSAGGMSEEVTLSPTRRPVATGMLGWLPLATGADAAMAVAEANRWRRGRRTALVGLAFAATLLAGCGGDDGASGEGDDAGRRAEVAERGAHVMPFDLEATTHRFEPTADGLVQTVVADDPDDAANVALVREHLAHEAERFAAGDYGDPASIHGDDMPGLAELEAAADAIEVTYTESPAGGRITYTTTDAALVEALHRWSEAQLTDHGSHAEPA